MYLTIINESKNYLIILYCYGSQETNKLKQNLLTTVNNMILSPTAVRLGTTKNKTIQLTFHSKYI